MGKSDGNQLPFRTLRFVEMVADPRDTRSVGAKAQAAGYRNPRSGYVVARREEVASAIEARVKEHLRTLRSRVARVLTVLADNAEEGDVRAAELFLQAAGVIGGRGVTVEINARQEVGTFPERLRRAQEERDRILEEYRRRGGYGYTELAPPVPESIGDGNGGDAEAAVEDAQSVGIDAIEDG